MNNSKIVNALQAAATGAGYDFRTGDDERMLTARPPKLPAALLSLPVLNSVEGRRHGRADYDIVLRLLDNAAHLSETDRNALRQRQEAQLLDMLTSLSDTPFVIAVQNITIAPRPFGCEAAGEVSVAAKARVITCF